VKENDLDYVPDADKIDKEKRTSRPIRLELQRKEPRGGEDNGDGLWNRDLR
jgi:hypothetical protein